MSSRIGIQFAGGADLQDIDDIQDNEQPGPSRAARAGIDRDCLVRPAVSTFARQQFQ